MTMELERMGRAELLARIEELEAEKETTEAALRDTQRACVHLVAVNHRLSGDHATMLETLTATQAVSTRLTNEARGVRHFLNGEEQGFADALYAIMGETYAAECKHGLFHPRLTNIPDGTGGADAVAFCVLAQDACSRAEKDGTLTWRLLAEEEAAELFAETDPLKIRAEAAQLGAVCAAWIRALDERGAR